MVGEFRRPPAERWDCICETILELGEEERGGLATTLTMYIHHFCCTATGSPPIGKFFRLSTRFESITSNPLGNVVGSMEGTKAPCDSKEQNKQTFLSEIIQKKRKLFTKVK